MDKVDVFIGYDPKEAIVFHVCTNSLITNSTSVLAITPLALENFSRVYRETHTDGSNQFIYSRFLVPYLSNFEGWAIYIDGDMIVQDDISKLMKYADPEKAVCVVKHDYKTKYTKKYFGNKNEDYPRKNWSSVILFNCAHPKAAVLTPEYVGKSTGAHLHRFEWLDDSEIGELDPKWNHLELEYDEEPDIKLRHYTIGAPCFKEYRAGPGGDAWMSEYHRAIKGMED